MDEEKNGDVKMEKGDLRSIRTYKSDVAEYIKSEGKTLADIAIAETQKRGFEIKEEETSNRNWKKIIKVFVITLILILISAGAVWFIIKSLNKEEPAPIVNIDEEKPSMFVSGVKERNISINDLPSEGIIEKLNTTLKNDEPFYVIHPTQKIDSGEVEEIVTLKNFFEEISIYPPGDVIRSSSDEFALGSIGGKVRFLVMKNNYYAGTFAGMLEWEKNIYEDLKDLLTLPEIKNTITSTTTAPKELKKASFVDGIISNRDVRMLKDGGGKIILIYVFPDNNTIIITSSENALKIVSEKLLGSKIK